MLRLSTNNHLHCVYRNHKLKNPDSVIHLSFNHFNLQKKKQKIYRILNKYLLVHWCGDCMMPQKPHKMRMTSRILETIRHWYSLMCILAERKATALFQFCCCCFHFGQIFHKLSKYMTAKLLWKCRFVNSIDCVQLRQKPRRNWKRDGISVWAIN